MSDATAREAMVANLISAAAGLTFCLEAGRQGHLAGVISSREAQSMRVVSESGGGQTRSQQPKGAGGTPA